MTATGSPVPSAADPAPLQPGMYCVVRTKAFFGRVIRAALRSPYDHAFLVGDGGTIIEATPRRGVAVGHLSEYAGCPMAANTGEPVTDDRREAVVSAALSYVHEGYNWDGIAYDALAFLGWHWRLLLRVAGADRRLVCSQLVAQAGSDAGLPSWKCGKGTPAEVTPADLARRPGVKPVTGTEG